ncbi:DUF3348 family protein [Paucibacter sp. KCTC 42545]|uniref:DUF3348 family protein n=1 Tax=Paucibacter sp. KCTC 42545 TaxID=1768242 RepID=UPI0012E378A6|nr:DUF3348 family protein [Paucibacter sp. KCTC 42545]
MTPESRPTPQTGSSFVRALAALAVLGDAGSPASTDAFAQRLSQWLDWTHAIELSAALAEAPPGVGRPAVASSKALAMLEADCAHTRAALQKLVSQAAAGVTDGVVAGEAEPDFAAQRQAYASCQQAFASQVGPLRQRLRDALAKQSPGLAKLAELDGLMERALGARERELLAGVPGRLAPRYAQLRRTQADASPSPATSENSPWLTQFHREMRALLQAELDFRLQAVDGLLEAFRQSQVAQSS